MSNYFHRYNEPEEIPHHEVYLLNNMKGGKFYIDRKDYEAFSIIWSRQTNKNQQTVTMDLAAADCHALFFDIDFEEKTKAMPGIHHQDMFPFILSTLKTLLLPKVKHFTYIIACRENGHGIHVHVPECVIAHDDYILLCEQLRLHLQHAFQYGTYHLDIPTHMTLPGAAKVQQLPYLARQITYVDEKNTFHILMGDTLGSQLATLKQTFKRVKDNANSFTRYLLFLDELQGKEYVLKIMMPVLGGGSGSVKPLYKLAFETNVCNKPNESNDHHNNNTDIAECTLSHSNEKLYISKGQTLVFNAAAHFLRVSHYLKLNAYRMSAVETNNYAVRQWFKRHHRSSGAENGTRGSSSFPVFDELNDCLRANNARLFEAPNPIQTILEFNNGYYFLPVFYALCHELHTSSGKMVEHLRSMLGDAFIPLLNRLEKVDETHTREIMKDLTLQTVKFCACNLNDRFVRNREKLHQMVHDAKRSILSVHSTSELGNLIRDLQESHFPIQVLKLSNSLKKPSQFIWNCLTESWQEIGFEKEKEAHITSLWFVIKAWLNQYRRGGHSLGGPDEDTIQKFQINSVLSMITSDTNIERKVVQMDRHKWFVRTHDGLLDILTRHVGGTVPELFLSDRKLGIDVPRNEMNRLLNDCQPLVRLYNLLSQKSFFQAYLKALFTDQTDDLFGTLCELVQEKLSPEKEEGTEHYDSSLNEPYATSMMHFYVHLCKFTAFDYDLLLYLSDILASIFIATNYQRKFFVFKGRTSNGKSKLFETLSRVFGGYYHCIQSDNLKPGNASTNASPDLASTLFNCRIVTTEELEGKLNENRVKQITGDSFVGFRNMYESPVGGIPTAKLFTTTNNVPDCQSSEAFRDRVVAIPFESRFVDKAPTTTSEQVRLNRYSKDEHVVEESYVGCFLFLMYHLQKHMDEKDGVLRCREAPPSVVEFTEAYLYNTDVYNQFKQYMDVQIRDDEMTTVTDLRSAVRQFLKHTKNNTTSEEDLFVKFEDEFKEYRKVDETVGSIGYGNLLDSPSTTNTTLEEEEGEDSSLQPPTKRLKIQDSIIYYENVVILNLRRHEMNS